MDSVTCDCTKNFLPDENANEKIAHILSAVILSITFESAIHKSVFLVVNRFSVDVLIGTSFINLHVNSILCIDQQVEFTNGSVLLLGNTSAEPTVNGLEFMEDDYIRRVTDTD